LRSAQHKSNRTGAFTSRSVHGAVSGGLLLGTIVIALNLSVSAQDDKGKMEYLLACAACHGEDGKGAGPMIDKLKATPANLTILAKRNNGVFSPNVVYEMIDGRKGTGSHRSWEMPIWGCRHGQPPDASGKTYEQTPLESFLDLPCDPEPVIQSRIRTIVEYLARIQAK
jgi:mono/diheme cytochrome c family protein